jgi:hypothetical protein
MIDIIVQGNLLPPFSMWKQLFSFFSALKMEAAGLSTKLHGATSHKAVILILTDMTTLLIIDIL